MQIAQDLSLNQGIKSTCRALDLSRASFYRFLRAKQKPAVFKNVVSALALSINERLTVFNILHSERFIDRAPHEICATLLDEGIYHCSVRTMYRLLNEAGEVRERRQQRCHGVYAKPELLATGPNQVWSWDITKLKGPQKWSYFHLYVVIDIFSRYVVAWMIAERESAKLAEQLFEETCEKQGIKPGQLTVHADRGSSMRSKPVAFMLADLGVTKTHNRPYTSNDNPFSESQFKTLKYCPEFPERFGSLQDARSFCQTFFAWYNNEHRHSGISMLTPSTAHHGLADITVSKRNEVLKVAFSKHPARFKYRQPFADPLPSAVWINKPDVKDVTPQTEGLKLDTRKMCPQSAGPTIELKQNSEWTHPEEALAKQLVV